MNWREVLSRLRDRLYRDRLSAELDEELRLHRQLLARDAGPENRSIGNVTYYREETRDMWSLGIIDDLVQDLRFALRVLRRDAGVTLAVVITLMLGIGANTAVFSIVNAVILRPLPYSRPNELVSIWTSAAGSPTDRNPSSLPDVLDWERRAHSFSGLAGFGFNRFDVSGPQGDGQSRGIQASGGLYEVLGAKPLIGRLPVRDEERLPVVAISYRLWLDRFAGDTTVVGQRLTMNGQPYTIVGVLPRGFHFPTPDIDLWTTMYSIVSAPSAAGDNPWLTSRSLHGYHVVARLAPGTTLAGAEREMNDIERQLGQTYPDIDRGVTLHLQSVRDDAVRDVQRGLWTVFGAAGLILLLACVNVAHLLLARMTMRARELAVRRALGAHRGRIIRQLITEALVLGLLGGLAGIGVAIGVMHALLHFAPDDIPRLENVSLDAASLSFAVVVSIVAALLFGVAPALLGWGRDVSTTLRAQGTGAAGGTRGGRTRAMLTSIEVAFAAVLLIGAGLMVRSFALLTAADIGVRPEGVSVAQVTFTGPRYRSDGAKSRALDEILRNIRALPGVTAAGGSTSMPPTRIQQIDWFAIEGQPAPKPGNEPTAIFIPATPGYLEALHIPVTAGRAFDARDDSSSAQVAIVSRELLRRYFAGVNPLGHHMTVGGAVVTVVGVANDAVYEGLTTPIKPTIYVPFAQRPFAGVWIALRAAADPRALAALAGPLRDAIHRVDPTLAAHQPQLLESMVAESIVRPRFHTWLLGSFGGLALLLASIGIYSVLAYAVSQRRAEIGIRLALGAQPREVVRMMLGSGMQPVALGLVAGLGVAFLGTRLLSGLLYGVAPTDLATFAGTAVVLSLAGAAAAYIPARRAAAVDPLTAIRSD
jgi:putative ABC transport system permease protein